MKLLLTSAGFTNKTIKNTLSDLVGRPFNKLNFVYVPTAANAEEGDKWWLVDDLKNTYNLAFKTFDVLDFAGVSRDIWLPRLESADILLFGGGNTFHLMYWLEKNFA